MNMPKIKIKRFDKNIPLPKRHTEHAAAHDLAARETVTIGPHQVGYVPLNVVIETPKGHVTLMAARSSLHKKGLMFANGMGVFDPDFSGDGDECKAILLNFTDVPVTVEKGDRIAQVFVLGNMQFEWEEVETMPNKTRGGIGSTGYK